MIYFSGKIEAEVGSHEACVNLWKYFSHTHKCVCSGALKCFLIF